MKTRYEISENTVEYFLQNKLVVKYGFDPIDITDGINWFYSHGTNTRSYSVYLHSLNFLSDLVQVGLETNNNDLIYSAQKILLDWCSFIMSYEDIPKEVWNEHAAAYRLMNIVYFQENTAEYNLDSSTFQYIIKTHCDFLISEDNYKMNNHGIMMDQAIMSAYHFIEDKKMRDLYFSKSLYRIKLAISRDFSRKGVHLENSPEYHRMVHKILDNLNRELISKNIRIGNEEHRKLNLAKNFNRILLKPNQVYPMIGDTGYIFDRSTKKIFEDFVDYESGIIIFQNENIENLSNSSWLLFKSGYMKKTHKHFDDLSVNLFLDGEDLLIDSGKYSYDKNDLLRKFFLSPKAHNTIYIKNKEYTLGNPITDQFDLNITSTNVYHDYKITKGINNLYEDISIRRTVVLTKDNICFIIDDVEAKSDITAVQNYVINEEAFICKEYETFFKVKVGKQKFHLKTFMVEDSGFKSSIKDSYISKTFSKYTGNLSIGLEKSGKDLKFLTVIHNEKIEVSDVKILNDNLVFSLYDNIKIIPYK